MLFSYTNNLNLTYKLLLKRIFKNENFLRNIYIHIRFPQKNPAESKLDRYALLDFEFF